MKLRIAIWAGVGALVVVFWDVCLSGASAPTPAGLVRALLYFTCPVALVRHYPLNFYTVLLVNAATYSLVGFMVESMRRQARLA